VIPELPDPSLVPFVIAATGHRDLRPQDLDSLRHEVEEVLAATRSRMPNTPLVLLTGLAEGADQVVAEVAIKQGIRLVAALPMPLEIYKNTMSEDAQEKLAQLLALSAVQIMLPLEGRTLEELRRSEDERAWCYEALAVFLARHGQALIALWDGKPSDRRGGTARVVHYVRSGTLSEGVDEVESRCGMVYQVVTPRMSSTGPAPRIEIIPLGYEPRHRTARDGANAAAEEELGKITFAQVEINFERFNREMPSQSEGLGTTRPRLIDHSEVTLSLFQLRLVRLYEHADAISIRANRERKWFLFLILATAMTGALFYGIHGEIFAQHIWLWFSFPFFVITALVLHWIARGRQVEERYLDARALAEALRVQFFWEVAGLKEPVDRYYLMHRRTELDWIRFALKNIWLLHQGIDEDTGAEANCRVVLDKWVKDQRDWYHEKAAQQSRHVRQRENISRYGLWAAVCWSILVPASILIQKWMGHPIRNERRYALFHIALAVPALLAAAYRLWIEQAGYAEQSREYQFMEGQFAIKAKELEKNLDTPAIAEKLLLELGIEALEENGRWLLLHRERPLEVLSSP
jgi:hypothetical protein